jgi:hypothetical protein
MLPAGRLMLALAVRAVLTFHTGPCVAPVLGLLPPRAGCHCDLSEVTPRATDITADLNLAYNLIVSISSRRLFAGRVARCCC